MNKEQYNKFMQSLFERIGKPPFVFCVYIDEGKVKYNEFDMQLNLQGGGDIRFLIDRLERLS